jgi:hypothetical protein
MRATASSSFHLEDGRVLYLLGSAGTSMNQEDYIPGDFDVAEVYEACAF